VISRSGDLCMICIVATGTNGFSQHDPGPGGVVEDLRLVSGWGQLSYRDPCAPDPGVVGYYLYCNSV
jgi:hypothetical protein